jgi:hypothetical protein
MDANRAFDTLLSELVAATRDAQQRHQAAAERNDLTVMVEEHERVMSLLAARQELERLRDSWAGLVGEGEPREPVGPTYPGARAPRGARTPGEAFWVPILQVLEEAGGVAGASAVEDGVGERMAIQLNEVDRARVRSGAVRWRVTLRFARHDMLEEGLLVDTSPRGIWEISQEGRAYLRRYRGENAGH